MKKKYQLFTLLCVLLFTMSGCGTKLYSGTDANYKQIESLNGVFFDMPTSMIETATAITSISENQDYSGNTYLYKNGTDTYLFFNIGAVVIAVNNRTNYNMKEAENPEKSLNNNSIGTIWCSKNQRKLKSIDGTKNGCYKMIATVKADVSITTEAYGIFTGKFATIQKGAYECSMFVGALGDNYKDLSSTQKKIIEHVAESLKYNEKTLRKEQEEVSGESSEPVVQLPPKEVEPHDSDPKESTDPAPDTTKDSDNMEETTLKPIKTMTGKDSDLYHLLAVPESGNTTSLTDKSDSDQVIKIIQALKGEEAIAIIKEYHNGKDSYGPYKNAPAGTHWEVVNYSLLKDPYDYYVNIRILGMDGEKLKYMGVAHTARTYDIFTFLKETEKGYTNLYCYYAVPNGCEEYLLECGERDEDGKGTACYQMCRKTPLL